MAAGVWYTTREDLTSSLDSAETARNNAAVDRAIAAATGVIDGRLHRSFAPVTATRTFDWPNAQRARSWRLWLDANELVSITAVVSGGVAIDPADVLLRPDTGPPYNRIELDLDSVAAFGGGPTHQRSIAITGVWMGCPLVEAPAGMLAEALDASETGVDVTDSAAVGVGHILRAGAERMIVTGKTMLTTGQTLQVDLPAQANAVTVAVTTGSAYQVGEVILLDGERMLIVDIAGNTLVVRRAWDGSTLATHSGATIYAPRTLTVVRGALGTNAATHDTATALVRHVPPPAVNRLATALAQDTVLQEGSGYAREVGSGESAREASGRALRAAWDDAYTAHGRKARTRAV
jgi:hypothetical protein